jgi:transketolase
VFNALCAARDLAQENVAVTVINIHTIKPLDTETVVREARAAGCAVSVEEHQIAGGLGSAIAEALAQEAPVPQEFIGVRDRFGQSGEPKELIEHYGMGASHIIAAVKKAVSRK